MANRTRTRSTPYRFWDCELPEHLRESLDAYAVKGQHPGQFIQACLENDLQAAMSHGDPECLRALPAVAGYIYNELGAPNGSPQVVREWIRQGGYAEAAL